MKSRRLRHAIGMGTFLIGLLLALPGSAAATGFRHTHRHGFSTHGFHQHRFGHFGHHHHPHFFRDRRGFLHRRDPHFWHRHGFRHGKFRHGGFYYRGFPSEFHHGSKPFFFWR